MSRRLDKRGFTLVELMAVVAIGGVLLSLLLAAVQVSREAARKSACANNLRNQVLALAQFHDTQQRFPPGRRVTRSGEWSWCLESLPFLEQAALASSFDRTKPWSDPAHNLAVANANLKVFRCPSAALKFDGKTDYAGINGSWLGSTTGTGLENGVMVTIRRRRINSMRIADITDGAAHTIIMGECTDRLEGEGGRWISGFNCLSHDNGGINANPADDIYSRHSGGAYVGLADGSVRFASSKMAKEVIGALCTRSGGETINEF
jgi:prepilin-type N-terminal cleavage/methylation domain-containing protein/prepilin-type processing-associated H-X9-DG protein